MGTVENCKCKCKYIDNNKKEDEVYFPNQKNNKNSEIIFNNNTNINKSNSKLEILFNKGKKNEENEEDEIIYKNKNNLINKIKSETNLINKITSETNLISKNNSRNINNNDFFKPEEQTTQTQRITNSKRESKDLLSQNSHNDNKKRKYRKSVDYIYKGTKLLNEYNSINDIESLSSKRTYNINLYKNNALKKSSFNLIQHISSKPKNCKKEYVSIKLNPRKGSFFHNNNHLNEKENKNQLEKDPIFNNITCKNFFNKYHLVFINSEFEYDINNLIEPIKLVNEFMDDSFFYTELNKINFSGSNLITKQILKRFCSSTKTEFRIYNSKEKFITLQNPMKVIKYKDIKKACYVEFEKMFSHLKNGLENEGNEKKDYFYFLIYLNNEKFEIFSSENENIIIKWVSIINYFISKQDDYEKCSKNIEVL